MRCVHQDQAVSPDDAAVHDYLANVVLHPAAGPLKFSLEQSARVIDAFKSAGYEPSRSAASLGPVLWLSVVAFNVGAGCTIVAVGETTWTRCSRVGSSRRFCIRSIRQMRMRAAKPPTHWRAQISRNLRCGNETTSTWVNRRFDLHTIVAHVPLSAVGGCACCCGSAA